MKTQYTIRNVPKDLDAKLRAISARQKRSLNRVIIEQLDQALLRPKKKSRKINHSFDDLFGKAKFDPNFEAALWEQRQVDPRDWQ